MNCSSCGTQLPQQATHCPQCGVVTQYSYATAQAAPDDPTVITSPETMAQQSSPSTGYGSTTYQNPYDPYLIGQPPPPPPRQRSSGGFVAVAILLVLLVIGAGLGAWFVFSSGHDTPPASNSTPVPTDTTPQHFAAQGTDTMVDTNTTNTQQDGDNQILTVTQHWVSYGDITGSFTTEEIQTLLPDKTGTFTGKDTCTCTVAGKSGTLVWSYNGTFAADGSFQGQFFDLQGTGDLATLHGQGQFQGQSSHATYSSDLYFDS